MRIWNFYGWASAATAAALTLTPAAALPTPVGTTQPVITVAQAQRDIVEKATADPSLTTLVALLKQVGIAEDFRGFGRFTIFAPTDTAFAAVPSEVLSVLRSDSALLAQVLSYHAVADTNPYTSKDLKDGQKLRTLQRSPLEVRFKDGGVYAGDARVVQPDILAVNGVIHKIDKVLIPADLAEKIRLKMQPGASTP